MTGSDASSRATRPRSLLARRGWPIGIALVLGSTMLGDVWMMHVAQGDPAFAVEPDYYRKAVNWDTRMAQSRVNAELGWRAEARLELARPGAPGRIDLVLRDRRDEPVTGATIEVDAMHNARASQRYHATLIEQAGGRYSAPTDAHRPGEWEIRLTADAGGRHFTSDLRLTATPTRGTIVQ